MPAKSKAQRRLFALALKYKRGEIKKDEVSDEVIDLSKLPEKDLRDFAETKEDDLPDHVHENIELYEGEDSVIAKYIDSIKAKFHIFIENLKVENHETREAFAKIVKAVRDGEKLSKEEKKAIGEQLKDVLKLTGFVAASVLPGGFIYLLISRISFMKKHMIPSSFLKENKIVPSTGTGARAGGGFPFGHEYGSVSREAEVELAHIKRDQAEKEVEEEAKKRKKKRMSAKAKSFDDFLNKAGQLTEMEGGGAVAASPTNTPGMGNVTPGEVGSGDKWGDDDDEDKKRKKRAMTHDEWEEWKKKSKKSQKGKRKAKGVQTQMAAWELGGRLPVPVANTVK